MTLFIFQKDYCNIYNKKKQSQEKKQIKMKKAQTLFNIITSIRVSRVRLSNFRPSMRGKSSWTASEQSQFLKLMLTYGYDLSLLQAHFPQRSRPELKRKYLALYKRYQNSIERQERQMQRERRKALFDEEILEENLIKWPNKRSSSSESLDTHTC